MKDLFGYRCEDYHLPDRMDGWNVIDIGSHAGTTAYQFLQRGAAKVRCFEPGLPQLLESRRNLAEFGDRAEVNHMAVWRSGEYEPVGYSFAPECPGASVSVSSPVPTPLKTVGLDGLILDAMRERKTIDLVKIDAECAEYPILYTSTLLPFIKRLRLEVHDLLKFNCPHGVGGVPVAACTLESVVCFLASAGYDVEWNRNGNDSLFIVSAERKD